MSAHTPGPYHVQCGAVWAEASDGSIIKIMQCRAVLNYVSVAERNANLKLMAAAPDLLAALIAMVNDPSSCTCYRCDSARDAIAKATGGAA